MSFAGAIGGLVRTTGWPVSYIMKGISVRALTLVAKGIAETYAPKEEDIFG